MKAKHVTLMLALCCGTTVEEYQRTARGAILLTGSQRKVTPPLLSLCVCGSMVSGVAQLMGSGVHHVASYAYWTRWGWACCLTSASHDFYRKGSKGDKPETRPSNTQAYGRTFLIQTIILARPFFCSEITGLSLEFRRVSNFLSLVIIL